MAFETPDGLITVPATTGLVQYRFVSLNTSGYAAKPTDGAAILGVVHSGGTTGSTVEPQYITVQTRGVAKVEADASTVSAGDQVAASTLGRVTPLGSGDYSVGFVVGGSSGGAGRILSVYLAPIGTT